MKLPFIGIHELTLLLAHALLLAHPTMHSNGVSSELSQT